MLPASVSVPLKRRPAAREGAIVALIFGGFILWLGALRPVGQLLASLIELPVANSNTWALVDDTIAHGIVLVTGMIAFTLAYSKIRGLQISPGTLDRGDAPLMVALLAVPPIWIAAVSGLASLTGTSLPEVVGRSMAPDSPLVLPAVITVLSLFIGLPAYVLLAHALIQRTLQTATGPWIAIGLTTMLVGFVGPTDIAGSGFELHLIAMSILLAIAIVLPAIAAHVFARGWLVWVCAVPLVLFFISIAVEWLTGANSLAGFTFTLAEIGVVVLGGYAYERTGSLRAPAVAYVSFVLTTDAFVYLIETGTGF